MVNIAFAAVSGAVLVNSQTAVPDFAEPQQEQHKRRLVGFLDYLDVLEDMGASANSTGLSDVPAVPEFEERGGSDGTHAFHVGIDFDHFAQNRRLVGVIDYIDVLEDMGASANSTGLSDVPAVPEFEERGGSDGTHAFHVGITFDHFAQNRRLVGFLDYLDVLEDMGASANSTGLSDVPAVPEFEERGGSDGSHAFHVGIDLDHFAQSPHHAQHGDDRQERRLRTTQQQPLNAMTFLNRSYLHDMEAMDSSNQSWPFLVEFQSIPEMNAAIDHHMMASPGRFQRLSMPALGDVNVTKLVETHWLAPTELEMSCHSDMVPALCHRFLPGDFFGITCVRYTNPSLEVEVTQLAGMACHRALHNMCHLALDFIVPADITAQVECPTASVMV